MVCVHTGVYVVDDMLFGKSHVNAMVIYTLEMLKILKKRMEKHFQYVSLKFMNGNNSDSFAAHFVETFTQKSSPQQY